MQQNDPLKAHEKLNPIEMRKNEWASITQEINESLRRIVPVYKRKNITIKSILNSTLTHIQMNPGKLQQVLMNLVSNSFDSYQGKPGIIDIETRDSDGFFQLIVRDYGCGIHKDQLPLVFDPFYTTKKFPHGSGMGLAIVHSIVKSTNGKIHIHSTPGEGTIVRIELPCT